MVNITDILRGVKWEGKKMEIEIDLFGNKMKQKTSGVLQEKFIMPPFSVFDAKSGDWQKRKKSWANLGIESELGRDATVFNTYGYNGCKQTETSIFDPVICELMYTWFTPSGGQVLDPFAGGSVRGIVASSLGRKYWGCDLRHEQIDANKKQAQNICKDVIPQYICGDSMEELENAPDADFIFSCPPYGDLEVYSDDPNDLSNMEYHTFIAAYKRIILRAIKKLKQDRFACFVVGDFRDKQGFYRNFVSETINGFELCGAKLYNEAILLTPIGTAAIRSQQSFSCRKLCKVHQNVLIFCKGDWRKAAKFAKGEL